MGKSMQDENQSSPPTTEIPLVETPSSKIPPVTEKGSPEIPPVTEKGKSPGDDSGSSKIDDGKKEELRGQFREEKAKRKRKSGGKKKKEIDIPIDPKVFHAVVKFPFDYLARVNEDEKWKLTPDEVVNLSNLTILVFKKHIPKLGKYQEEFALGTYLAAVLLPRVSLSKLKQEKPEGDRK